MAGSRSEAVPDSSLSEDAVMAYLLANPDFLQQHPDLVRHPAPPSRFADAEDDNRVVDMQGFMVSRLQSDLERARDNHDALINSARSNLSSQSQIHRCALAVLDARDFEHFINIVTNELPLILDVDTQNMSARHAYEKLGWRVMADAKPARPGQQVRLISP